MSATDSFADRPSGQPLPPMVVYDMLVKDDKAEWIEKSQNFIPEMHPDLIEALGEDVEVMDLAIAHAEKTIKNFNASLRPGETPRRLIEVLRAEEEDDEPGLHLVRGQLIDLTKPGAEDELHSPFGAEAPDIYGDEDDDYYDEYDDGYDDDEDDDDEDVYFDDDDDEDDDGEALTV